MGVTIQLNKHFKLEFLAPEPEDLRKYARTAYSNFESKRLDCKNNPEANLLSTVVALSCDNWCTYFTSDATKEVLGRVKNNQAAASKQAIITQVPHHGSIVNHNFSFWKLIKSGATAVVSVGENSYGHPDESVLNDIGNVCQTYQTNTKKPRVISEETKRAVRRRRQLRNYNHLPEDLEDHIWESNCDYIELVCDEKDVVATGFRQF